jgi:hypothetical protein
VGARSEPAVGWWVLVGEGKQRVGAWWWWRLAPSAAPFLLGQGCSSRRVVVVVWLTRCLAINLVGVIAEEGKMGKEGAKRGRRWRKPRQANVGVCVCERTAEKTLTRSVFRRPVHLPA